MGKVGTQMVIPYRGEPYWYQRLKVAGDLGQVLFTPYELRDEESIKLEKDYYEANTESSPAALALNLNAGSNQVCLPDQLNALGYSRSDLAKVTLKKPRVTFTSQQVLQLEQEFKIQR